MGTGVIDFKLVEVSLDEAVESSIRLADELLLSFKPSIVVGILKGGFLPAVEISDRWEVPCQFVGVEKRDVNPIKQYPFGISLDGLDVLLVDDVYWTGATMNRAEIELKKSNPRTLRTAVLSYSGRKYYEVPDFFDHLFAVNHIAERYPWSPKSNSYGRYKEYVRSLGLRRDLQQFAKVMH
ncbi:hypothetical protein J4448_03505 [Candidatus Woesearchaeota archaeon]|nr:hypothetical protein [Candidatus Woesearchaeota archaeon]